MSNLTSGSRVGKSPGDLVDSCEQLGNEVPEPRGGPVVRSEALEIRAENRAPAG
jgi:hypothetical protein